MDLEKARLNDERLLTAVGSLTVSWAHLEFGLDAMILVIHNWMDGAKYEKQLPVALKNKINYLRAAFKRLGVAPADLPRWMKFLDDVKAASETRHDIIHGFPIHHPSDEGEAKLIRLLIQKDDWVQKPITITIASVLEASATATALAGKASNWVVVMADDHEKHLAQAQQSSAQQG